MIRTVVTCYILLCIDADFYLPMVQQFLHVAPDATQACTNIFIKPISPADRPTRTFTVSVSPLLNDSFIFLEPTSVLIRLTNEGEGCSCLKPNFVHIVTEQITAPMFVQRRFRGY